MTKSLGTYLFRTLVLILEDHVRDFPELRASVDRDVSRLTLALESRGLPALTLDLPALGKHFDKCLAAGLYQPYDGPFCRTLKGTAIPRLFSGLLLQVFHRNGVIRGGNGLQVQAIRTLRQVYNLAKKVKIDCAETRKFQAIRDFYTLEETLPPSTLYWGTAEFSRPEECNLDFSSYKPSRTPLFPDCRTVDGISEVHLAVCQRVADTISGLLGYFDPEAHRPRHGPGAVSDLKASNRFKYRFPTWSDRLENVFPSCTFAFSSESTWADAAQYGQLPSTEDVPAKLCTVPKTQKGPRLIAVEPTANQWCQQIIADFLATRISATYLSNAIDFRNQVRNQEAAKRASVDGGHWTVDLSSASDRVTCRFVERLFRANYSLLAALNASRTPYLAQKLDKASPSLIRLKKFSTMGNACTFPVESISFLVLAISACLISKQDSPNSENIEQLCSQVLVYGDDVVIPSYAGTVFCQLLEHFDFKVNTDKTFGTGKFRESCGVEMFDGTDVTPVYLNRLPEESAPSTVISALDSSNNLHKAGWWAAAEYVTMAIPRRFRVVVDIRSGVLGLKSFCGTLMSDVKNIFNWDLQRLEIRAPVLRTRSVRRKPSDSGLLLQYFTEAPSDPTLKWESGWSDRPRVKLTLGRVPADNLGRLAWAPQGLRQQ